MIKVMDEDTIGPSEAKTKEFLEHILNHMPNIQAGDSVVFIHSKRDPKDKESLITHELWMGQDDMVLSAMASMIAEQFGRETLAQFGVLAKNPNAKFEVQ